MNRYADTDSASRSILTTHIAALLLTLAMFYLHTLILFDIAGLLLHSRELIVARLGPERIGKAIILCCFILLFTVHVAEASVWALFLRWRRIFPSVSDGLYFTVVTSTALGYGDMVLPRPFRQIAPLIAISGVLMFGCSTAFIFVLMQQIWTLNIY